MTTPTQPTPRTVTPTTSPRRPTRRTLAPLFKPESLPLFHAFNA